MKPTDQEKVQTLFFNLHWSALALVYSILTARAVLSFRGTDYDFLNYHLPCALRRFDLTSFTPAPDMLMVCDGFPPLASFVQGFLVAITGSLNMANTINTLAFYFLLLNLWMIFGTNFRWRWFLTALLAIPLFVLHFFIGYIDLWVASALCGAFVCATVMQVKGLTNRFLALFAINAAIATFSKFQALPIVGLLELWVFVLLLKAYRRKKVRIMYVVGAAMIGSVILLGWPAGNTLKFGNPTYPIQPPMISTKLPGYSWQLAELSNQSPAYLNEVSNTRRFLSSAFELNRLQSDQDPFVWSLDAGARGAESPHHRMGGWFFATVILMSFLLVHGFLAGSLNRIATAVFFCAVGMISIIPQSHELRYWLFIPMSGLLLLAMQTDYDKTTTGAFRYIAFLVLAGFVLWTTRFYDFKRSKPADFAPTAAKEFWLTREGAQAESEVCLPTAPPFDIYWSGPTFSEYRVRFAPAC